MPSSRCCTANCSPAPNRFHAWFPEIAGHTGVVSYLERPAQSRVQPAAPTLAPVAAATVMACVIGALWLIEGFDVVTGGVLDGVGITPRDGGSLPEIFVAPLLHHGWPHLIGNTVPLAGLGFMILLSGVARWINVTMISIIASGLTVWLFAPPNTLTAGASGVVFGYLAYLMARGFFTRNPAHLVVGVALFFFAGGMLLGVLPGADGVSWQGHLGGAIGGLIAAKILGAGSRAL